jgi:hypothetical protein
MRVADHPTPDHVHERAIRRADDRPELVVPQAVLRELPEPEQAPEADERDEPGEQDVLGNRPRSA